MERVITARGKICCISIINERWVVQQGDGHIFLQCQKIEESRRIKSVTEGLFGGVPGVKSSIFPLVVRVNKASVPA